MLIDYELAIATRPSDAAEQQTMTLASHIEDSWQPISTAPFSSELELAVMNGSGAFVLVFACRRMVGGWLNVAKGKRIEIQPTHWRRWTRIASIKRAGRFKD